MFGQIGFSYIGLIVLLLLIIPNYWWRKNLPEGYDTRFEHGTLMLLERIGQVSCAVCALMFDNFNPKASPWILWLIAAFILMGLYELCWIRYFKGKKREADLYRSFHKIPLPFATLPTAVFLLLGIYGGVIWMIIFAMILGVGHIGIHYQHLERCWRRGEIKNMR